MTIAMHLPCLNAAPALSPGGDGAGDGSTDTYHDILDSTIMTMGWERPRPLEGMNLIL